MKQIKSKPNNRWLFALAFTLVGCGSDPLVGIWIFWNDQAAERGISLNKTDIDLRHDGTYTLYYVATFGGPNAPQGTGGCVLDVTANGVWLVSKMDKESILTLYPTRTLPSASHCERLQSHLPSEWKALQAPVTYSYEVMDDLLRLRERGKSETVTYVRRKAK
jgi:hypothetical protein